MKMQRTIPWLSWAAVLALSFTCLALAGCGGDDSSSGPTTVVVAGDGPAALPAAADISGVWDTNMTQPEGDTSWSWDVDVTIVQTGQAVQGSFRAGTPQTFTGTYVGGVMTATDSLDCLWQITFSESAGNGTRTRSDQPVTVVRMMR
jgi:hypothetical protein